VQDRAGAGSHSDVIGGPDGGCYESSCGCDCARGI
jgi:hypothetical protein